MPDVSLLASPDFPSYIYCTPIGQLQNSSDTTSTCASGIATALNTYNSAVGGTSVSSPVFAGIVTLLNQYLDGPSSLGLGNINSQLYTFAAANSTNHAFHPVTTGDNDVSCEGGQPSNQPINVRCPGSGTSAMGYSAANSDSATGYNLVNGLGSIDADNFFTTWDATRSSTTATISTTATTVYQGASVTFTSTVTPASVTGNVDFYNNSSTLLGVAATSGGTATFTTTALPAGTDLVTASYGGDGKNGSSPPSSPATVTVTVPYTMSASPNALSIPAGNPITTQITITPASGFSNTVNFTPSSCTGLPAGATCSFANSGSVPLNGASPSSITMTVSTAANMAIPSGPLTVTITGTSGTLSEATTVTLTVAATNQSFTIAPKNGTSTYSVTAGQAASVDLVVSGTSPFVSSNGTQVGLNYSCTGLPSEANCNFSPSQSGVTATSLTLSISTTAPTTELRKPFGRDSGIFYAMLLPGVFGIVFAAGSRRRGARLLGLIIVLGFSTLWLGACGGSSSSSQNNPGTPAGSYQVTISAQTPSGAGLVVLKNSNPPCTITLTVAN